MIYLAWSPRRTCNPCVVMLKHPAICWGELTGLAQIKQLEEKREDVLVSGQMNCLSGDVWTYRHCCCRQPCSTPLTQSYYGCPRSPQRWRGRIGLSPPQNTSGAAWHGMALSERGPSTPLEERHLVDWFTCPYVIWSITLIFHTRQALMIIQQKYLFFGLYLIINESPLSNSVSVPSHYHQY